MLVLVMEVDKEDEEEDEDDDEDDVERIIVLMLVMLPVKGACTGGHSSSFIQKALHSAL